MIKCEVVENFDLKAFGELKNIIRKSKDDKGKLYIGDTFECSQQMAEYLTGNNPLRKAVVKIIEVQPEKKEEPKAEGTIEYVKEDIKPEVKIKKKKASKK